MAGSAAAAPPVTWHVSAVQEMSHSVCLHNLLGSIDAGRMQAQFGVHAGSQTVHKRLTSVWLAFDGG